MNQGPTYTITYKSHWVCSALAVVAIFILSGKRKKALIVVSSSGALFRVNAYTDSYLYRRSLIRTARTTPMDDDPVVAWVKLGCAILSVFFVGYAFARWVYGV